MWTIPVQTTWEGQFSCCEPLWVWFPCFWFQTLSWSSKRLRAVGLGCKANATAKYPYTPLCLKSWYLDIHHTGSRSLFRPDWLTIVWWAARKVVGRRTCEMRKPATELDTGGCCCYYCWWCPWGKEAFFLYVRYPNSSIQVAIMYCRCQCDRDQWEENICEWPGWKKKEQSGRKLLYREYEQIIDFLKSSNFQSNTICKGIASSDAMSLRRCSDPRNHCY